MSWVPFNLGSNYNYIYIYKAEGDGVMVIASIVMMSIHKRRKAINNLLRQCKSVKQVHQVHSHIATTGMLMFGHDHSSSVLLINILAAFTALLPSTTSTTQTSSHHDHAPRRRRYALSLFNLIPNSHRTTFAYNTMIRAHTLLSSPLPALAVFVSMRRLSVPPDTHTFPFCLKAAAALVIPPASTSTTTSTTSALTLTLTLTLHSQAFKFGFGGDLFVCNTLIHAYSLNQHPHYASRVFDEAPLKDVVSYNALMDGFTKVGDTRSARQLFDEMPVRDAVSWGTLLAGYARQAHLCADAIQLFNTMLVSGVRPDNIALVSALSACAQLGKLEQGRSIHMYMKENGVPINAFLSTGLVDLYAKCGCIETAREIFEESAPDKKNLFTWNALLVGLGMHGRGHLSLDYLSRMIEAGIKPDGVSLLGVLVGCSHAGLVSEARKIFEEMEVVYGVPRELKHYGCMADLLGRAGLIREAMEMIEGMPTSGDAFVWGGVLGGCRIHGIDYVEIAEEAAQNLMILKPQEDDGVYSVLVDIYANAGRWEDVERVRRNNRWVKKNPASSSIIIASNSM